MYLLNLAQFWSLALYLQVWQHLSHGLEMILHVWETSKEHFVHGALIEAEILTSPLPMYLLNLAWFMGASALPIGVSPPQVV